MKTVSEFKFHNILLMTFFFFSSGMLLAAEPFPTIVPETSFTATKPYKVHVILPLGGWKGLGQSEPGIKFLIPECQQWFVEPVGLINWTKIGDDLRDHKIPGLWLSKVQDKDLEKIGVLPALKWLYSHHQDKENSRFPFIEKLAPNLTFLDLGFTYVTDAAIAEIAKCENLEILDLSETDITDVGIAHLSGLRKLKQLRLYWCFGVSGKSIRNLSKLKSLEKLDVTRTQVKPVDIAELKSQIPNLKETYVDKSPSYLMNKNRQIDFVPELKGMRHLVLLAVRNLDLSPLQNVGHLETVILECGKLSVKNMEHLGSMKGLRNLNLQRGAGVVGVENLAGLTSLENLLLGFIPNESSLLHLKNLVNLKKLEFMCRDLRSNLSALKGMSGMEDLMINSPQVSVEGLKTIGSLTSLKHLALSGAGLGGEPLEYLKNLVKLRSLRLGPRWQISDKSLGALRNVQNLETFAFTGNTFTGEGLKFLQLKRLSNLNVSSKEFKDSSLAYLASAPLTSLAINSPLGVEGLKHIAKHKKLKILKIDGSRLLDDDLATLKTLQELEELHISASSSFTHIALRHLSALPNLKKLEMHGKPRKEFQKMINDLITRIETQSNESKKTPNSGMDF